MDFIPHFPLQINAVTLFGLTVLLGLVGGELAARTKILPRITAYIMVGVLCGPEVFNIAKTSVLIDTRIFVEISLSLILFDLGRHLDFVWLRHDLSLLGMSITESLLTFLGIFSVLFFWVGFDCLPSMLAGIIAMPTSPAVVMMVADDLLSEGPVTRRTLMLTSLNNFYAILLFTLLLPVTQSEHLAMSKRLAHAGYLLIGSILLGAVLFFLAKQLALLVGKNKQNQFILFVGLLVITMGLSNTLHLSYMLTLFSLGVLARNFDGQHVLMEIDFKWLARIFIILLFVVIGVQLKFQGLWSHLWIIVGFILTRFIAKAAGIGWFYKASRLTKRQAMALSLTLTPMAGVAIGMSTRLVDFDPNFSMQLIVIISAVVAALNLIGPILTQAGFITTGEASVDYRN